MDLGSTIFVAISALFGLIIVISVLAGITASHFDSSSNISKSEIIALCLLHPLIICVLVGLLLFATTNQPYGYYEFLRWAVLILSIISIMTFVYRGGVFYVIAGAIFLPLAILFNPLILFEFNRSIWIGIDITAATLLIGVIGAAVYEPPLDNS